MTEPVSEPTPATASGAAPGAATGSASAATPNPAPAPKPSFEERMESFGREAGAAGERLGRDAEAWGQRLAKDPSIQRAGDTATRAWGLIVLAIGIWFFIDVTLGYDMPRIAWGEIWPIGLIVIGLFVIVRGMGRRSA
jgi:hypothetical protein